MQAEAFRKLYPTEYLEKFLKEGVRPDGRALWKLRSLAVTPSAITSASGSSLVKLGETTVVTATELKVIDLVDERYVCDKR